MTYEPLLLQCQKFHLRERSRLRGAGARLHCEVNTIQQSTHSHKTLLHYTQHNNCQVVSTVYNCCCCSSTECHTHTTVTPPASLCTARPGLRYTYTLIDCCLTPHALLLPKNLANWLSTDKGSQLEAYLEAICSSIYTSWKHCYLLTLSKMTSSVFFVTI